MSAFDQFRGGSPTADNVCFTVFSIRATNLATARKRNRTPKKFELIEKFVTVTVETWKYLKVPQSTLKYIEVPKNI